VAPQRIVARIAAAPQSITAEHQALQLGTLEEAIAADDVSALEALWARNKRTLNGGDLPLMRCIRRDAIKSVRWLVQEGRVMATDTDTAGFSPLWIAAQRGRLEILKILIALPHVGRASAASSLFIASECGQLEVVKFLALRSQARINEVNGDGESPLWVAAKAGMYEVVVWLVEHGKARFDITAAHGVTPLHVAVQSGSIEVVKYLVGEGSPVDAVTQNRRTPLFIACREYHVEIVKFLLRDGGAEIDQLCEANFSHFNSEVVAFLQKFKLDLSAKKRMAAAYGRAQAAATASASALEESQALAERLRGALVQAEQDIAARDGHISAIEVQLSAATKRQTELEARAKKAEAAMLSVKVEAGEDVEAALEDASFAKMRAFLQTEDIKVKLEAQAETLDQLDIDVTCVICLDAKRAVCFFPCSCFCLCEACAAKVWKESPRLCPACRKPVRKQMKLFVP
jgi:hypothetical protein